MDDSELAALCQQFESQSIGEEWDEISQQQEKAINYYYRRPFGDEAAGQSQVVDGTVGIVIDNAMAAVLKPFVSADDTVSFAPRGPEDVEQAEQATEYINYVVNCDNPGFLIFHNWFKDALLTKLGVVKVWWEDTSSAEEMILDAMGVLEARQSENYLDEQDNMDGTFTVTMRNPDGRVKIEVIPPEEYKISPYARSIRDATYQAHAPANVTRSDLIAMGFDPEIVETLAAYSGEGKEAGREEARYRDERYGAADRQLGTPHKSQEIIPLRDEYIRVDYDGDGVAELRRVVRVSDTILLNEEVEEPPFAGLCPVPMPHKVYGLSLADQVMDLQRITSVLWRQMLDNLYKSNNPRPHIPMGAERADGSTGDSLMDNAPGAAVLEGQVPIRYESVPFVADKSFGMMEFLQLQQEERSGISRSGQGIDTNALKKSGQMTATEMSIIASGKNARAEMIARIFAETGVSDLFKLVLKLLVRHQPKARMIRLRNKWIDMDPRMWNPDMDLVINVGLGMGERSEQIMQADAILQTMAELGQTPFASMIGPKQAYEAIKRKFHAAGVKDVDQYLIEPEEGMEQPQQPSPEQMKAEGELQMQAAKLQAEQQMQSAKLEAAREEMLLKQQLAREEAEFEAQLAREKATIEIELAREKMTMEAELARERAAMDATAKVEISKNRPGGDLAE
jgi:hypothetical protein